MPRWRLTVSSRFMLVLILAFLCQAGISVASLSILHQSLLRDRTAEVKNLLDTAYSSVAFYQNEAEQGRTTDAAARRAARTAVRAMRYGDNNYYFIWTLDGTSVAHGSHPEWEGQRFINSPQARAHPGIAFMVTRLVAVAKSPAHEGITTYSIPKLGETIPQQKIAYSRLFVPWGWSVGTGVYVDDINATFRAQVVYLVALFGALIGGAGIITFLLSKNVTAALSRLSARVASVAAGEFDGEVPEVHRADEVGVMARALLVLRDNSRDAAAAHTSDVLTGLPNRRLLVDRIRQALSASARNGEYGGLMFIDLDRFKALNDTLGHDAGDMLLRDVAARLVASVRRGDTVARLGGDEFVIVFLGLGKERDAAAAALETLGTNILAVLQNTFHFGGATHASSASLGVTLFHDDETPVDVLLKQSDLAMYKAKDSGRNCCRFFDPHMEILVRERAELEEELLTAISEKQFALYYQIQIGSGGTIKGAEALIRWHHPTRGMVSPLTFIPFAEETGLIVPIGEWVLDVACAQLHAWAADPAMADLKIAVNVSCRQFAQDTFVDNVLAALKQRGADPNRLELELTESLFVDDVDDVIRKMMALQAFGVSFSLDDFGTGYSSLSYLKRMPLDHLKIDQTFVRDLLTDSHEAAIAQTIVALATSLNLRVVAEGVETREQRDRLAGFGCHYYQGYFYSKPVPVAEFEALVRSTRSNTGEPSSIAG